MNDRDELIRILKLLNKTEFIDDVLNREGGWDGHGTLFEGDKLLYLDLSYLYLDKLPLGIFDNLSHLLKLDLGGNAFSYITEGIFEKLTQLTHLNFSLCFDDLIEFNDYFELILPETIFDYLSELKILGLAGFHIKSLPSGIFKNLQMLEELDLSYNLLSTFPSSIFDSLVKLKDLNLSRNKFLNLPRDLLLELKCLTLFKFESFGFEDYEAELFIPNDLFIGQNLIEYDDMGWFKVEYNPNHIKSNEKSQKISFIYKDYIRIASISSEDNDEEEVIDQSTFEKIILNYLKFVDQLKLDGDKKKLSEINKYEIRSAIWHLKDQNILKKILNQNENFCFLLEAIRQIKDEDILINFVKNIEAGTININMESTYWVSKDGALEYLYGEALWRILDQTFLKEIIMENNKYLLRLAAIVNLEDQKFLINLALNDDHPQVRRDAIKKLKNRTVLKEIAKSDLDQIIRREAVIKVQYNKKFLLEYIKNNEGDIEHFAQEIEDKDLLYKVAIVEDISLLKYCIEKIVDLVLLIKMKFVERYYFKQLIHMRISELIIDKSLNEEYQRIHSDYNNKTDDEIIRQIAKDDENWQLRKLSVERIANLDEAVENQDFLFKIFLEDNSSEIRRLIFNCFVDKWMEKLVEKFQYISKLDITEVDFKKSTGFTKKAIPMIQLIHNLMRFIIDNQIKIISSRDLLNLEIERLDLSGLGITSLPEGTFIYYNNLRFLNLSSNRLKELPNHLFNNLNSLEVLKLNNNELVTLPRDIFHPLRQLKKLYLFCNHINELPDEIFLKNEHLKRLWLNNNKLASLPTSVAYLENLSNLYIEKNCLPKDSSNNFNLKRDQHRSLLKYDNLRKKKFQANIILQIPSSVRFDIDLLEINNTRKLILEFFDTWDLTNENMLKVTNIFNFEELTISGKGIKKIFPNLFDNVFNLRKITILKTQIKQLPSNIFKNIGSNKKTSRFHIVIRDNENLITLGDSLIDLTHVSKIEISGNENLKLEDNSLKGLVNLKYLDLSFNNLTYLPENLFSSLEMLNYLNLSQNKIINIPSFKKSNKIQYFNLSNNKLKTLDAYRFNDLTNLIELDIFGNQIQSLEKEMTDKLSRLSHFKTAELLDQKAFKKYMHSNFAKYHDILLPIKEVLVLRELENISKRKILLSRDTILGSRSIEDRFSFRVENHRVVGLFIDNSAFGDDGPFASIKSLPKNIGDLTYLRDLSINYTQITSLPESILTLQNLEQFGLGENRIESLPDNIKEFVDRFKNYQIIINCKKAIKSKPYNVDAYLNWGVALSNLNKYNEAIEKFKKVIEFRPNNDLAYAYWGNTLMQLHNYSGAIKKYRKAIEHFRQPVIYSYNMKILDLGVIYYNWGCALAKLKTYTEAFEKYEKALQEKPGFATVYVNWGSDLIIIEKYEDAIEKLKKAIELDPQSDSAYYNLGTALLHLNKYEESIEKFENVVKINPRFAEAYCNWGDALKGLNNYDAAITKLNTAININPELSYAYYDLACIYSICNNEKQSIHNLQLAIIYHSESNYFEHLAQEESDFKNIRSNEVFTNLIEIRKD